MKPNKILNVNNLVREIKILLNNKASIIYQKKHFNYNTIVIKKESSALEIGDSIDKWTFGIITNGKREDWIKRQIKAIKAQKIPNYEIIICGSFRKIKDKNFRYIEFKEHDDKGWITAKKNKILEKAKYENVVVMHDKMVLDGSWFKGMKKYGNYFDVLSCIINDEKGTRTGDWLSYGNTWDGIMNLGLLSYKDWDKYGYIGGYLYIIKKSTWKKAKWDENLFWNQAEDIALSKEFYNNGIVARFNPYSKVLMLDWRFSKLEEFRFNPYKLGKIKHTKEHYLWYFKQLLKRHVTKEKQVLIKSQLQNIKNSNNRNKN